MCRGGLTNVWWCGSYVGCRSTAAGRDGRAQGRWWGRLTGWVSVRMTGGWVGRRVMGARGWWVRAGWYVCAGCGWVSGNGKYGQRRRAAMKRCACMTGRVSAGWGRVTARCGRVRVVWGVVSGVGSGEMQMQQQMSAAMRRGKMAGGGNVAMSAACRQTAASAAMLQTAAAAATWAGKWCGMGWGWGYGGGRRGGVARQIPCRQLQAATAASTANSMSTRAAAAYGGSRAGAMGRVGAGQGGWSGYCMSTMGGATITLAVPNTACHGMSGTKRLVGGDKAAAATDVGRCDGVCRASSWFMVRVMYDGLSITCSQRVMTARPTGQRVG